MTIADRDPETDSGPRSIVEVANHMLAIGDGLLDEDEEMSDPLTEAEAAEIVRREYVSGSCGAFAIALHDVTGHRILAINGGLHVAVRRPDGMLVDFMGVDTIENVAMRYGMSSPLYEITTRDQIVADTLSDDETLPWSEVRVARWVVDHLGRW